MFIADVYNAPAIAAYIGANGSENQAFLGEAYFPDKKKMGIDLKWFKGFKNLGVTLKPSAFDAIPTIRARGSAQMTKEQMPLFRESMLIKETDLMELSRVADANDPFLQPIVDSLYSDSASLVEGARIAAEKERMALMAPINGNAVISIGFADNAGYTYNYDANGAWKVNHYMALTGNDTWDNGSTAKPLDDLQTAISALASRGTRATTVIGNSTTFSYLLGCDQIKNAVASITGMPITFIDNATVEEVLKRRLRIEFIAYDKMYTDTDGTDKKFYPDNYVTVLGDGQLGNLWRGTTPEELTKIGKFVDIPQVPADIEVLNNGIAIAVKTDYKPSIAVSTTVSQTALPSFEGMDKIYVIKVK